MPLFCGAFCPALNLRNSAMVIAFWLPGNGRNGFGSSTDPPCPFSCRKPSNLHALHMPPDRLAAIGGCS